MKFLGCVLFAAAVVHGHGVLTLPVSRAVRQATGQSDGLAVAGSCPGAACTWYSQDVRIPGKATNCDPKLRTMGVTCGDQNPTDFPCSPGAGVPWCAPGTAPVRSPCGIISGGWRSNGRDMLDLPSEPQAFWLAGSVQEVAFAITANHGGGYAYRLCPAGQATSTDPAASEKCFQANHLSFSGDSSWLVGENHTSIAEFPAVRTSTNTFPEGSQWTRNPVPMEKGLPAIPGHPELYGRGPFTWSVMDKVNVPSDLPAGDYVLSWRWDAEQTKQVWSHCSDVHISNTKAVQPAHTKKEANTPTKDVCIGGSLGLDITDCASWVDMYDSLGGSSWPKEWSQNCPSLRLDPCGCSGSWDFSIVCVTKRDLLRLTEIYILGSNVQGQLPDSIGNFGALVSLSLVGTRLSGVVPETIGNAKELSMVWLDHNPALGGPIPMSFSKLQLTAFELHKSNFSGALPSMHYANIPDCTLNDLVFDCPLPAGADTCGAACK